MTDSHKLGAISLIAAILGAMPSAAQNAERHRAPGPLFVQHDHLLGAMVTNGRTGDELEVLGKLSDLEIDRGTGRVHVAVLELAGSKGKQRRAINWGALTWDPEAKRLTLAMSRDDLEELPGYREPTEPPAEGGGMATLPRDSCALASRIVGCKVLARGADFGSCETLWLEVHSGSTTFVTVKAGGVLGIGASQYVVPWRALTVDPPIGKRKTRAEVRMGRRALDAAPKLSDKGADIANRVFRNRVYDFYGVEPPAFEPVQDSEGIGSDAVGLTGHDR